MDVRLSLEQQALRRSAVQVVERFGLRAVGQLDDLERIAKLEAAVDAAGWRELRVAAEVDADEDEDANANDDILGPLASGVEAAIVAEELSRGLAAVAYIGPTLAAELRRRAGAPAATGPETVLVTPDLTEVAIAELDAPVGSAIAVDSSGASCALLLVPGPAGVALGTVETKGGKPHTDLTRGMAACEPWALVRSVPGQGRPLTTADLSAWTALGLALTCADLLGTMRGAVDLATQYAKDRTQYGRPIGSFQAVQHLLADAFVAVDGSRSVALHAAWAVDALAPDDALASAALAKAYAARAARTVCETAIQVHGGIGNTWECLAHLHLRRALLSTDLLGGTGPCLDRVLDHAGLGRHDAVGGSRGLR